jgi:hypothetical protein
MLPIQAAVEISIVVERYPHIFQLARLIAETKALEKIKRFDQGGQAQMLFQRRTDNLIKARMKNNGRSIMRCHLSSIVQSWRRLCFHSLRLRAGALFVILLAGALLVGNRLRVITTSFAAKTAITHLTSAASALALSSAARRRNLLRR